QVCHRAGRFPPDDRGSSRTGNQALGHPPQGGGGCSRSRRTAFAGRGVQPLYAHGRGIPVLAIFDRPARPRRPAHHAHPTVSSVIAPTLPSLASGGGKGGGSYQIPNSRPPWPAFAFLA